MTNWIINFDIFLDEHNFVMKGNVVKQKIMNLKSIKRKEKYF